MKDIEQLLQLEKNPYYQFTPEERARLDDFLSTQKGQENSQPKNGTNSERNSRATVVKNIVQKDTGVLPTAEQTAAAENLADQPAHSVGYGDVVS